MSTSYVAPARVRSLSWARATATGKLLGIGHIGLFVVALLLAMAEFPTGRKALAWAHRESVATAVSSWGSSSVVRDATAWLVDLPWSTVIWTYFILAIACFVMRCAKRMPGWLSLPIALAGTAYGALSAISNVTALAGYWPVMLPALIVSWIVVARTIR